MRRFLGLIVVCVATAVFSAGQTFTTLATFYESNGATPLAGLVQGADGNFYGTTNGGGDHSGGTVFKMTPEGDLTALYSFCSEQNCQDGQQPLAPLIQGKDGNFYGTTSSGGNGYGTVFKITPAGNLTTLHRFQRLDGDLPGAALVQASDGNFYGTTTYGGNADGGGTIFKITSSGDLSVLYYFCAQQACQDGKAPAAALVQATDGNFYSTTLNGGTYGYGTVFEITPNGDLTALYSFCSQWRCPDGDSAYGGVVQATDGNFYGTTQGGGSGYGTVFKITPNGNLITLHRFSLAEGNNPRAGLVQASDGNFYGTNVRGGSNACFGSGCGTLFKITPDGVVTTLHAFNAVDGSAPSGALMQATDGSLYGTTSSGGPVSAGTVFRLDVFSALSLTKVGSGTVGSVDGHIYCGTACSYSYDDGTQVTLSAVPAPGYTFTGWTGCDNINGSYCVVTMTSAKNVAATFTAAMQITLTSLTFKPAYVRGGQLSAGTLTLSGPAPPGGLGVALSSDHPSVAHPPSFVIVPGGKSLVQFAVQTFPLKSNTTVAITATAGLSHVNGTVVVGTTSLPPSLK